MEELVFRYVARAHMQWASSMVMAVNVGEMFGNWAVLPISAG